MPLSHKRNNPSIMLKHIFTLFLLSPLILFSQNLKIMLTNPEPRQGDELDINLFLANDNITYDEYFEIFRTTSFEGQLNLTGFTKDTGVVSIGPLTFKINNTVYTSDSIKIKVIENLPNVDRGIWLRVVKSYGAEIFIIEQRLSDKEFMDLDYSSIKQEGLKFTFAHSKSTKQKIENNQGKIESVKYRVTIYLIEKENTFQGSFNLDKKYFKDNYMELNSPKS